VPRKDLGTKPTHLHAMPVQAVIQKIARFFNKISPDCRTASLLQSQKLDDSTSSTELIGLRLHLLLCSTCRRYRKQLDFIRETAKQANQALTTNSEMSSSSREKLKALLKDQPPPGS
jgi:hypothetical protein